MKSRRNSMRTDNKKKNEKENEHQVSQSEFYQVSLDLHKVSLDMHRQSLQNSIAQPLTTSQGVLNARLFKRNTLTSTTTIMRSDENLVNQSEAISLLHSKMKTKNQQLGYNIATNNQQVRKEKPSFNKDEQQPNQLQQQIDQLTKQLKNSLKICQPQQIVTQLANKCHNKHLKQLFCAMSSQIACRKINQELAAEVGVLTQSLNKIQNRTNAIKQLTTIDPYRQSYILNQLKIIYQSTQQDLRHV